MHAPKMVIHMAGLSLRVDKSIAFQLECRLVIELKLPEYHAVTILVSSLVCKVLFTQWEKIIRMVS